MGVLTLDSIGAIYRPMIMSSENPLVPAVYFILYILVVSIALMNLVTAIMVEGALKQANDDAEYFRKLAEVRKAKMIPLLRDAFVALDTDNSGGLSLQELLAADAETQNFLMSFITSPYLSAVDVFKLIDIDGSGSLDIEEFLAGLLACNTEDGINRLQMARVLNDLQIIADCVDSIWSNQQRIAEGEW